MIENFDSVKKELKELAGVVNSFKSEAVQLRIVELLLNAPGIQEDKGPEAAAKRPSRRKKRSATKSPDSTAKRRKKTTPSGQGAAGILNMLVDSDFFSKPKTINDLIEHCSHNHARRFKANDFSGKLSRMTRNGRLKRKKNADNQYEYTKA